MRKLIILTIVFAVFASCSDSDTYQDIETPPVAVTPPVTETPPVTGTPPGTPGPDPVVVTSYSKDVKSIIDSRCIGCHQPGRSAGFRPLTTYAQVKSAVESAGLLSRIQLENGQPGIMPTSGRMSQTNIDIIVKWNTDGLKEN